MAQHPNLAFALTDQNRNTLHDDANAIAYDSISSFGDMPEGEHEVPNEITENLLALYFKEMANLSILKPEEEFDVAQNIEHLEVKLWAHLLSYLPVTEIVLHILERMEFQKDLSSDLASLRVASLDCKKSSSEKRRLKYQCQSETLAKMIYKFDVDRRALLRILAEMRIIARGDRSPLFRMRPRIRINSQCKGFKEYIKQMRTLFSASQKLRNEFVKANLRLVVSIARRFNYGRMPLNDLIQEGNIGLIKAVERYDYRRGYRFSTYASWWIRHAISRALADKGRAVRLPVHMLDAHQKLTRSTRELCSKLGRLPTIEEIAADTGLNIDKVEKLQSCLTDQTISLDRFVSDEDDRRYIEMLQDGSVPQPVDKIMEHTLNHSVREAMKELKPIEADILSKRFGLFDEDEHTLKEIGDNYHLSRERIRQIQEQALKKVRRSLEVRKVI